MRFLNVLMDEHRGFSAMLDVLEAIADRLERRSGVPMPMLVDVLDFFEPSPTATTTGRRKRSSPCWQSTASGPIRPSSAR